MTTLEWNKDGERFYEAGLDRAVIYIPDDGAYAWNGLINVEESTNQATVEERFYDGRLIHNEVIPKAFRLSATAFTYPLEFQKCVGNTTLPSGHMLMRTQRHRSFDLTYRTLIGNDSEGEDHGYILHLVYGCTAIPRSINRRTLNSNSEADLMGFDIHTKPVEMPGFGWSSHYSIDSRYLSPYTLQDLEARLYGTNRSDPELPPPSFIDSNILGNGIYNPIDEPM